MNPFLRILEDGDHRRLRSVWRECFPHLPPPVTDSDAKATMHLARTQCEGITERLRFYSHRWLLDHDFPSMLPDILKPRAERLYPKRVLGVGVSIGFSNPILKPLIEPVMDAVQYSILEAEADGRLEDTPHVRARMKDAKDSTLRRLLGNVSSR